MKQRGDKIVYVGMRGCDDMEDNDSRKAYRQGVKLYSKWLEETHGVKYTGQMKKAGFDSDTDAVRAFTKDLVNGALLKPNGLPYSAASISTYSKAVCHAFGVDYKEVNGEKIVPKRTAGRITKGTGRGEANPRGRQQVNDPKYQRFVTLARVTGARRAELADIRGRDLVQDESGYWCVKIESGKGGKTQLQRILPGELADVRALFSNLKPKDFVLDKKEIKNKIDVHFLRAKRSQLCYDFYLSEIRIGGADKLRLELIARWDASHIHGDSTRDQEARKRFLKDVFDDKPYKLRGSNKKVAEEHGRPTELNRLAMMCVSVFCLSHWRLDVTSTNYLSR